MSDKAHVGFFSGAAASHVFPMLAIAGELAGRGYRVSFTTTNAFAPSVRAAGVRPVVPTASPPPGDDERPRDFFEIPLLMLRDAIVSLASVEAAHAADPPDIVLTEDPASPGAIMAAKRGVPVVPVWPFLVSEKHWTERYGRAHPRVGRLLTTLTTFLRAQGIDRTAEEHYENAMTGGIVLLPKSFQPGADELCERHTFVGPCLGKREPPGADQELVVLDRPHVLVSLGSINTTHPEFFRTCVAGLAGLEVDVVFSVGKGIDPGELGPLPPGMHAFPWLPQLRSLESAVAIVCHGGMNSLMEAFRHGVPAVIVPRTPEQVKNAKRVLELGLGRAVSPKGVTSEGLRTAVTGVMTSEAVRRRVAELSREMVRAGGTRAAADAVEAHLTERGH